MKKKIFLLFTIMAIGLSNAWGYDFSYTYKEKTLYYNIVNGSAQVTYERVIFPVYSNLSGALEIPSFVPYNGTTYSVTSIGEMAFYDCSGLTSVTIPNSVTSIGDHAFNNCRGLTSVTIPNPVTSIGIYAFYGCSGLTSVTIPNSVTSIGRSAFYGCSGLTSVTIPNSVTSIGANAFYNCSGLTRVNYTGTLAQWCNIDFGGYAANPTCYTQGLYIGGTLLEGSLVIPEGVEAIKNYAFNKCQGLTSVTIPNSVTTIGDYAFYGCSGLTSVTIGNSVTSIGSYAFDNCSGLTSVTIPNSVTSIGSYSFRNCIRLTSVTIPNSVTYIGEAAFYGCSGLTSVTIGNSVTYIAMDVFSGCSSLTSVTIPNLVTFIGTNAFEGCSNLQNVIIGNSVSSINGSAFDNCPCLKTAYNLSATEFRLPAKRIVPCTSTGSGLNTLYKITAGNGYTVVGQPESSCSQYQIPREDLPDNFIYSNDNGTTWQARKIVLTDGNAPFSTPVDFTAETVEFDRSFYTDRPSTVCLPFVTTAAQRTNFKLYDFSSYQNGTAGFTLVSGNSTANRPYIIEYNPPAKDDFQMPTLYNVQFSETPNAMPVVTDNNFNFVGTLQQASMSGVANRHYYGLYYGYFVESGDGSTNRDGSVNAVATVNPFRSYFYTDGTSAARPTGVDLQNEGEVSIELVDPEMNIQYSNDVYDLMGRCVRKNADSLRGLPKGIYIWKGKKQLAY